MNSIKNAIVTMTMLAVGYGAYVVLSSPMPEDGEELAGVDPWAVPEVSEGKSDGSADPPSGMAARSAGSNAGSSSTLSTPDIMLPPTQPASAEVPTAIAPSVDATAAAQATPASGTQAVPTTDTTNGYADQASLVATSPGGGNATDWPPPSLKNAGASTIAAAGAAGLGAAATAEKSPPPSERRESSAAFEMVWTETTQRLQEGQMGEALLALSAWYGDPSLSPEQVERCVGLLDQLAGSVIYSQESFLEPAYVVRDGDTLDTIALEYGVSKVFLARVNGIGEPYEIKPGESLKVVRGPFHAEISRSESTITLFVGRYYAGRFHARIGADLPVAPATYDVAMIEIGREYFDRRTGQRVEASDPQNPYGPRWIGLRGNQITTAHNVGIHVDTGVTEEGCLAVSMTDAEDLASILTVGSRVTVKD